MPHRVSLSRQAADGARRVAELERQLEQLEYDNRFRRFKYRLLTASHSFLLWQQEQLIVEAGGEATLASCYAGRTAEDLLPITHLQSDLNIEQIGDNPTGSRSSWTTLQSVQSAILIDPARPLAPSDDSLWMVREVCSCPPHPEAENITMQQLRARYNKTVQRLSLLLNMLKNPHSKMHGILHPSEEGLGLILDHLSLTYTLWGLCNKSHLVVELCWSNCSTGESYGTDPCREVYLHVMERLQLSVDQQERIAWGYSVFNNLLQPVTQERQKLQQQLAAEGVSSAVDLFASAVLPAGMRRPGAADQRQHRHQQVLQRLQLVMKKGLLLEVCMTGHTLGCLSLKQQCQMFVDAYPIALGVTRFSLYVAERQQQSIAQHAKEQQQQELSSKTMVDSSC